MSKTCMISFIAHFISTIAANSVILYVVSTFIPALGFSVSGGTNIYATYAILGVIFWFFNAIVKKIIQILTIPFSIITLGLSSVVINIVIIYVFGYVVNSSAMGITVSIGDIIQTLILSVVISIAYFIIKKVL